MSLLFQLLLCCLILCQNTAYASEGASSYYFPGCFNTFVNAAEPAPGFMTANQMLFYSGKANKAVLNGKINLNLEAGAFYNYAGGYYTFKKPVLNSRLQLGAFVPIGNTNIETNINTPLGSRKISDTDTGIGDSIVSAALYWKKGNFHYKLVETVFVPTGKYSINNSINAGRNYTAFDTSLFLTWLNVKTGNEVTISPGIMFNNKNKDTDYKSGNEFHFDFALNRHYFKKHYAVGLHGYYYHQLTDDSGNGAVLGGFKGKSMGIGPAFLWTPKAGKGNISVIAKWLHDIDQKNRMKGNYSQITVGYKF